MESPATAMTNGVSVCAIRVQASANAMDVRIAEPLTWGSCPATVTEDDSAGRAIETTPVMTDATTMTPARRAEILHRTERGCRSASPRVMRIGYARAAPFPQSGVALIRVTCVGVWVRRFS